MSGELDVSAPPQTSRKRNLTLYLASAFIAGIVYGILQTLAWHLGFMAMLFAYYALPILFLLLVLVKALIEIGRLPSEAPRNALVKVAGITVLLIISAYAGRCAFELFQFLTMDRFFPSGGPVNFA